MEIPLKKLAILQMGYSFRSSIPHSLENHAMGVLQVKDIDSQGIVHIDEMTKVMPENLGKGLYDYHVKPGDLIFRSRGPFFVLSTFPNYDRKAVFLAPLIKISLFEGLVLPDYLQWYFRTTACQNEFNRMAEGTTIKMIGKSVLEDLLIQVPSIEDQQLIVDLYRLMEREKELSADLLKYRSQLIEHVFLQSPHHKSL